MQFTTISFASDRGLSQILIPRKLWHSSSWPACSLFLHYHYIHSDLLKCTPYPNNLQASKLFCFIPPLILLPECYCHITTQIQKKSAMAKPLSTAFKRAFHNLVSTDNFNLELLQWSSTWGNFVPQETFSIAGDIFDCHNWRPVEGLLASSK